MLVIKKSQMDFFDINAEKSFEKRIADFIRKEYPNSISSIPEEILAEKVRSGISLGRKYGMTWESSLTAFVSLIFAVSPGFHRQPVIHSVLTNQKIPANERIKALFDNTSDSDWKEAEFYKKIENIDNIQEEDKPENKENKQVKLNKSQIV